MIGHTRFRDTELRNYHFNFFKESMPHSEGLLRFNGFFIALFDLSIAVLR